MQAPGTEESHKRHIMKNCREPTEYFRACAPMLFAFFLNKIKKNYSSWLNWLCSLMNSKLRGVIYLYSICHQLSNTLVCARQNWCSKEMCAEWIKLCRLTQQCLYSKTCVQDAIWEAYRILCCFYLKRSGNRFRIGFPRALDTSSDRSDTVESYSSLFFIVHYLFICFRLYYHYLVTFP